MPGQHPAPFGGNLVMYGPLSDAQAPGRKRVALGDVAEKGVKRRQKRMIMNRESAARSRARRQAYTHDLENKVSLLEEENERLKRQKVVHLIYNLFHSYASKSNIEFTFRNLLVCFFKLVAIILCDLYEATRKNGIMWYFSL